LSAANQIDDDYVASGKVRLVLRDFPLTSIHPQAVSAAEAARCAGDQGGGDAYWAMHDQLFEQQSEWSGDDNAAERFKSYAGSLGLDGDAFNACLDGGDNAGAVLADMNQALEEGLRVTPSFVLTGVVMEGALPFEAFQQNLETVLAGGVLPTPTVEPTPEWIEVEAPSVEVEPGDAPAKGDPAAPVTIIEFSDFQCPYCARFVADGYAVLIEEFVETGRVHYVFKDFPLTSIHPLAVAAAQAAHCAREQGGDDAYFAMHDALFAGQETWSKATEPTSAFAELADGLDLDGEAIRACLAEGRYASTVEQSFNEAVSIGLNGTPSFVMNGQVTSGALTPESLRDMIEGLERGEPLKTWIQK